MSEENEQPMDTIDEDADVQQSVGDAQPNAKDAQQDKQPAQPPDSETLKILASAFYGELLGAIPKAVKKLRPRDHELLQKIATNAIKFRMGDQDMSDKRNVRKAKQIAAQLSVVRAFGRKVATEAFWQMLENVLTRLSAFALTKI